jgi:peptide/nickel transport system permease protein
MLHLLRRVGFYMVSLWVSITLNFFLPRLAPGDPAQIYIARFHGRIPLQALEALRVEFGVSNAPLWLQYFQYLNNLLHGNLGIAISYFPTPVSDVIAQNMPWTLLLAGVSVVISFLLGTLLGVIAAWRRGGLFDSILSPLMTLFSSIPYFWLALIALYLLAFSLTIFPLNGGYDPSLTPGWNLDFIGDAIYHSILPALTIIISSISGWMLSMRNVMMTTLAEDYVLMAEAKGLSQWRVMFSYAARNAILPNVSSFALALGFVVGGQLLTEVVFSYPGLGFALLKAVQQADYSPLQTYQELANLRAQGLVNTDQVRPFQLDEYIGIPSGDPRSLYGWSQNAFLVPLGLPVERLVRLRGDIDDIENACHLYDTAVKAVGGFDLAILGLGPNGHLGFNEPPSRAQDPTRRVRLTPASLMSNATYWGRGNVPREALTCGMHHLLAACQTLLLVSGAHKRDILWKTVKGPITPDVPSSYLQHIPNVIIVADKAAWPDT